MLWSVQTRCLLLRTKLSSLLSKSLKSSIIHRRHQASVGIEKQATLEENTEPELDTGLRSNVLPPEDERPRPPPKRPSAHGVWMNRRGQLQVFDQLEAEKECCTAVIISGVSKHLTKADFMRILPQNKGKGEDGIEGLFSRSRVLQI
jgi:hypothetical protein